MKESRALQHTRRVFLVILLARLTLSFAGFLFLSGLSLSGLLVPVDVGLPFLAHASLLRLGPTLLVTLLTLLPLEQVIGQSALAVCLLLDVAVINLEAIPFYVTSQGAVTQWSGSLATYTARWADTSLMDPFWLVMLPLVLMGWAYGRKASIWASIFSGILYLAANFIAYDSDLWARMQIMRVSLRIAFLFVVPVVVATLAERERAYVAGLEDAQARLQRHAATAEELAVSRERNRLARDLHDTLAHSLAALVVHLDSLRTLLKFDPDAALAATDEALALARRGLRDSREAIQALRVDPVEVLGLVGALGARLQAFKERTGVQTHLNLHGQEPEVTPQEAATLYRIAEESLANVERHAHAKVVWVTLAQVATDVVLDIVDDGVGFDPIEVRDEHYGLLGMRERAALIGAEFHIESQVDVGTRISCTLTR